MAENENGIKMNVIAIQIPLWFVFQSLLAALWLASVPMPLHLHATRNFGKKEAIYGSTKVWTHDHANANSKHNHLTNSCFMMINIILWLYYHSTWSSTYLK